MIAPTSVMGRYPTPGPGTPPAGLPPGRVVVTVVTGGTVVTGVLVVTGGTVVTGVLVVTGGTVVTGVLVVTGVTTNTGITAPTEVTGASVVVAEDSEGAGVGGWPCTGSDAGAGDAGSVACAERGEADTGVPEIVPTGRRSSGPVAGAGGGVAHAPAPDAIRRGTAPPWGTGVLEVLAIMSESATTRPTTPSRVCRALRTERSWGPPGAGITRAKARGRRP